MRWDLISSLSYSHSLLSVPRTHVPALGKGQLFCWHTCFLQDRCCDALISSVASTSPSSSVQSALVISYLKKKKKKSLLWPSGPSSYCPVSPLLQLSFLKSSSYSLSFPHLIPLLNENSLNWGCLPPHSVERIWLRSVKNLCVQTHYYSILKIFSTLAEPFPPWNTEFMWFSTNHIPLRFLPKGPQSFNHLFWLLSPY